MTEQSPFPQVEVAVVIVTRGDKILAVHNSNWGAFTLPMTKRRAWQDPNAPQARRHEEWSDAAARAATECLGRTLTGLTELPVEVPPYQQSDRSGEWKRYQFRVFRVTQESNDSLRSDRPTEWLSVEQFLDERRRPISPTARHILKSVGEAGCLD